LELYDKVPPVGQPWGGSVAASHLRAAVEVERRLLRDVDFKITGDIRDGERWAIPPSRDPAKGAGLATVDSVGGSRDRRRLLREPSRPWSSSVL